MSRTKLPPEVRRHVLDLAQHPRHPDRYQCAACRRYFPLMAVEIDHIIPEADSTPEQRSDPDNLQVLCNPKGSTRHTSCHKAKTVRENRARYKSLGPRKKWWPTWLLLSATVITAGVCWQYVAQKDAGAAATWLKHAGAAMAFLSLLGVGFNAWRFRKPRRVIPVAPPPKATGTERALDTVRITAAVREIVGAKGSVFVEATDLNHFTVSYKDTGFPDHDDDKRFEVLAKIQAKIEGRWRPVWNTQDDLVTFSRRPALERMVPHPGLDENRLWNIIPIAAGVVINLLVTPHVLIIGTTGAGKTALMRTSIVAVADSARRDDSTRMILADPKLIEMPGFIDWPGVSEVVGEPHELWDMALDLEREMWRRLRLIKAKKAKPSDFKKIICVIDEYEQYFQRMDAYWKSGTDEDGKPLKKPGQRWPDAILAIRTILSMARKVNIHLIIGTQSPDATWFGGTGARENLSGRIAVGPVDSIRARMMFDDSSIGRDIPIEFKGRATVQVGNGAPEEIQCYYTPDPFDPDGDNTDDDWAILARLGMEAA